MSTSRRQWLRHLAALTAGAPVSVALMTELMASPVGHAEEGRKAVITPKVRLNANENPYGPSAPAKEAVRNVLVEGNRYVFSMVDDVRKRIAGYEGVDPACILMGAGSSETLIKAGIAFGLQGGRMISAFPTFPILMDYAEIFGVHWDRVDVNDRLEHDFSSMLSAIRSDTRLVFVCNPNNPTGTCMSEQAMAKFCMAASGRAVVFVDEAYLEFCDPALETSMVRLIKEGSRNVIVSRTFSKIYGLAGLRFGYAVAHPELIKRMDTYRVGFPLSQPALAAAMVSLGDREFTDSVRSRNASVRSFLSDYLSRRKLRYGDSVTNFLIFKLPIDPKRFLDYMDSRGILIRVWDFDNASWCRVSLGTMEEVQLLTAALDEIIA